MCIKIEFS